MNHTDEIHYDEIRANQAMIDDDRASEFEHLDPELGPIGVDLISPGGVSTYGHTHLIIGRAAHTPNGGLRLDVAEWGRSVAGDPDRSVGWGQGTLRPFRRVGGVCLTPDEKAALREFLNTEAEEAEADRFEVRTVPVSDGTNQGLKVTSPETGEWLGELWWGDDGVVTLYWQRPGRADPEESRHDSVERAMFAAGWVTLPDPDQPIDLVPTRPLSEVMAGVWATMDATTGVVS